MHFFFFLQCGHLKLDLKSDFRTWSLIGFLEEGAAEVGLFIFYAFHKNKIKISYPPFFWLIENLQPAFVFNDQQILSSLGVMTHESWVNPKTSKVLQSRKSGTFFLKEIWHFRLHQDSNPVHLRAGLGC